MTSERGRFGAYLERALECLRHDSPTHFAATRRRLGNRSLLIRIAGDVPVQVSLAGDAPWVTPMAPMSPVATMQETVADANPSALGAGQVEIAASERDLHAFLRGDFTIEEGLQADRLAVRGALDDVLAFLEALGAWLHGALRAPSFPPLHRRFLAGVPSAPSGDVH